MERALNKFIDYSPHIIAAAVIYLGGLIVMKLILRVMRKGLTLKHVDVTLHKFLMSIVHVVLMVLIIVMSLSALQVPMTSIVTTIGAAGLAIGLALQNSLSNVAGGFIILFSKPFQCGDFIETSGVSGTVDTISILHTRLLTVDNKQISIPNGVISQATVTNYTAQENRRLELEFSIGYTDDHHKAMDIIREVINSEPLIQHEPDEPLIAMKEQAASAIILIMRVWIPTKDYWPVRFSIIEKVKEKFDENGISIPFNQLDVHLSNH